MATGQGNRPTICEHPQPWLAWPGTCCSGISCCRQVLTVPPKYLLTTSYPAASNRTIF